MAGSLGEGVVGPTTELGRGTGADESFSLANQVNVLGIGFLGAITHVKRPWLTRTTPWTVGASWTARPTSLDSLNPGRK